MSYRTHKALGECWRPVGWHWPARDCKTAACATEEPNRMTHDWAMVSCKSCLKLRPRTTPALPTPKRVRKKKGAASAPSAEAPMGRLSLSMQQEGKKS